jgi:uncharacterized membrane-anchored protein
LRYDISSQDRLRKLPGWQKLPKQQPNGNELALIEPGTYFYVILQEAPKSSASSELPSPWKPMAVSLERPSQLPANQVVLKGLAQNGFIQYGLETYYIPEDQREEINADLRAARQADPTEPQQTPLLANPTEEPQPAPPVVMEIKVNAQGDAVPVSVWVRVGEGSKQQIRNYRF